VANVINTPVATVQPSGYPCVATLTAPQNPVIVLSNFDTVWTVKNTSEEDWTADSVDYKYINGTKMNQKDVYNFAQTIKTGESGKIVVGMIAPGEPGIYNTTWAIVSSSKTLCAMTVTVTVTPK
jgi:precorrin-3B methylase